MDVNSTKEFPDNKNGWFSLLNRCKNHVLQGIPFLEMKPKFPRIPQLPITDLTTELLKMPADCLYENLSYLSLKDIKSLGEACTQLQKSVGEYFRSNFVSQVSCENGNIYLTLDCKNVTLNFFSEYVRSISIQDGDLEIFQKINFDSINEIELFDGDLHSIESAKDALAKVETLRFFRSKFNGDIYEKCLQFCGNLKHLFVMDNFNQRSIFSRKQIETNNFILGTSNDWLTKEYPKLEHFELNSVRRTD